MLNIKKAKYYMGPAEPNFTTKTTEPLSFFRHGLHMELSC